ncbi:MAG: hypothetical protein ACK4MF_06935 [Hyphomicrobiaceae bacterium]
MPTPRVATGAALGGAAGAGSQSLPDMYDRRQLTTNPERDALLAYVEQLPPGHPERVKTEAMLNDFERYPIEHPARTRAEDNMNDLSRLVMPALSGAAAGGTMAAVRATAPFRTYDQGVMSEQTKTAGTVTSKQIAAEAKRGRKITDVNSIDDQARLAAAAEQQRLDQQRQQLDQQRLTDAVAQQLARNAVTRTKGLSPDQEARATSGVQERVNELLGPPLPKSGQRQLPPPATSANSPSQPPAPPVSDNPTAPIVNQQFNGVETILQRPQLPQPLVDLTPVNQRLDDLAGRIPGATDLAPVNQRLDAISEALGKLTTKRQPNPDARATYTKAHSDAANEALRSIRGNVTGNEAGQASLDAMKAEFIKRGLKVPPEAPLLRRLKGTTDVFATLKAGGVNLDDQRMWNLAFGRGRETLALPFVGAGAAMMAQPDEDPRAIARADDPACEAKAASIRLGTS